MVHNDLTQFILKHSTPYSEYLYGWLHEQARLGAESCVLIRYEVSEWILPAREFSFCLEWNIFTGHTINPLLLFGQKGWILSSFYARSIKKDINIKLNKEIDKSDKINQRTRPISSHLDLPVDQYPGGDSHMKWAGMLVGNCELNPKRRQFWAWPNLFLAPERPY